MTLDQVHPFSKEEALARVHALTDYWAKKYGVRTDWSGDRAKIAGKVNGVKFDGQITVEDSRISGDIKAGFLAEKLGGRQYVEGKLGEYLSPATSLERLQARV